MSIAERIQTLEDRIHRAIDLYHRERGSVCFMAVSKNQSTEAIKEAYHAGLRHFGESYLQEAITKIEALSGYPICWHFIGPIQSNKTKRIAEHFSWVHSVSRMVIAEKLSEARPESCSPLNVCIQVNYGEESTKSGVHPDQLTELVRLVEQLPRLNLRGLMILPKPESDREKQYEAFLRLNQTMKELNKNLNLSLDTLSMGMSNDFQAAIRAGSTIVRVGRGVFGTSLG